MTQVQFFSTVYRGEEKSLAPASLVPLVGTIANKQQACRIAALAAKKRGFAAFQLVGTFRKLSSVITV